MGSNDANCLDKKNLTVIDYNSNMQEMSSKSITYKHYNNNLHPFNFSDEINCNIKQELYEKSQNSKDNIVQTTCGGKSSKNETKTPIKQNLSKINANCVLPKGIKILKGMSKRKIEKLPINNSLQSNIPTQISLEQDVITRCNNDKSIAQTFCNDTTETITTTENIREKKHHTSHEINKSFDTLKISSPLNNNVDLKDKDLSNNKLHSKVIDYTNLNSATKVRNNGDIGINNIRCEIITAHENYTLSNQEQLNRFTNNTELHKSNVLQDNRKYEAKCIKNILNKNVSDLMDIDDENYNISTSSILASKEENILLKETLKRTLKEKDCNQGSKKMKLNRDSWLQSNVAFKSSNYQQDNDSLSSVTTNTTVETNKTKKYNPEERPDLRKFLNPMRSEKSFKLKPTVEIANEEVCKKLSVKEKSTLNKTLYEKKSDAQQKHSSSVASDDEDDDCISLLAKSFAEFDTSQCEDISLNEKDKSSKSLHCDVPYTASSFDKYVSSTVKENNKEFNKKYAKCIENDIESLKSDKANEIFNHQSTQVLNTDCVPATAIQSKSPQTKNVYSKKKTLYDFVKRYCYQIKEVFQIINSEDSRTILDIMPEALTKNFNYFCEEVYVASLKRLNIDEILGAYKMLHDNWNVNWRKEFTKPSRKNIASNIIEELLNRQMSLKIIVDHMVTHILPTKNLKELNNILLTVNKYVKPGEYWNTTKKLILTLQSNVPKYIIDQILNECIRSKELQKIQDVNSNLINKLDSSLISKFDKCVIMTCFKSMLVEKTAENSEVLTQNFGDSLITTETIASPDSPDPSQSISFTQQEPPTKYDVSSIINKTDVNQNENHITQDVNVSKPYVYGFMQPIDAPYARSMYRDHEHFWKFYMDLERFEKGLIHEDYNYVIDILKSYTEKRESELFVNKCCLILRNINVEL
ncbi:Chitin-binding type-2 domain-containing protein [Camponotus japonicus]